MGLLLRRFARSLEEQRSRTHKGDEVEGYSGERRDEEVPDAVPAGVSRQIPLPDSTDKPPAHNAGSAYWSKIISRRPWTLLVRGTIPGDVSFLQLAEIQIEKSTEFSTVGFWKASKLDTPANVHSKLRAGSGTKSAACFRINFASHVGA